MLETPTVTKVGNQLHTSYGSDQNLFVHFYEDAVLNQFRTEEEGIESFDQFSFIEVVTPGNKNKHVEKVALWDEAEKEWIHVKTGAAHEPSWQKRFPQQWEQFKSQQEQVITGFPVTECPFFTKAYALNLKSQKVHTLEQIRDLPDTGLDVLGLGGRNIRDKVTAYLNRSVDVSEISKLIAKIEKLEADNAVMKEMLGDKSGEVKENKKTGGKNG